MTGAGLDLTRGDLVTLDLAIYERSPLAIHVALGRTGRGAGECWLPLKLISLGPMRGRIVAVTMPRTLALEKRLISEAGAGQGEMFPGRGGERP